MTTVLLVIHLMVTIALVGIIMVQRSEGGALGIGGGGGGGFMTARGAANLLTRMTAILAAAFFVISILLAILASREARDTTVIDGGVKTEQGKPGKAPGTAPDGANTPPKLAPVAPPPSGPQLPQSK
jgi:preprotein translocase subunit SecG